MPEVNNPSNLREAVQGVTLSLKAVSGLIAASHSLNSAKANDYTERVVRQESYLSAVQTSLMSIIELDRVLHESAQTVKDVFAQRTSMYTQIRDTIQDIEASIAAIADDIQADGDVSSISIYAHAALLLDEVVATLTPLRNTCYWHVPIKRNLKANFTGLTFGNDGSDGFIINSTGYGSFHNVFSVGDVLRIFDATDPENDGVFQVSNVSYLNAGVLGSGVFNSTGPDPNAKLERIARA